MRLVLALLASSACSEGGGTREKPADLSLSASGNVCVDPPVHTGVAVTLARARRPPRRALA